MVDLVTYRVVTASGSQHATVMVALSEGSVEAIPREEV